MRIRDFFKRSCVALSLLMLLSCGGGGESSAPATAPTTSPNIHLAQSSFDFAGIVLNSSADQSFDIENTGNESLKIGQILDPALPFSLVSDTCSNATLTPSQTCSLKVRFLPTSQGSFTTKLSVPSNDPDSKTMNINISGIGYGLNVWVDQINTDTCPSISADVTVSDPISNSVINTLTKDNFKLYQNGQLQDFTASLMQSQAPVSLVLALDMSGSTAGSLVAIKSAANAFINLMNVNDRAAICKFNQSINFYPASSPLFSVGDAAGKTALISNINSGTTANGTFLYDTVFLSIDRAAQGTTDRRAVIVLTDGVDQTSSGVIPGSARTVDQVIANATQKGIPVFTIYYLDPSYQVGNFGDTELLQRLARETGGQYYSAENANLSSIFQQISIVLRNKYTLNITSSTCSGTMTLEVRTDWNSLYGQGSKTITFP
jgi:VWFA-related protein